MNEIDNFFFNYKYQKGKIIANEKLFTSTMKLSFLKLTDTVKAILRKKKQKRKCILKWEKVFMKKLVSI